MITASCLERMILIFASNMKKKKAKENLEDSECSDNELGDLDDDKVSSKVSTKESKRKN